MGVPSGVYSISVLSAVVSLPCPLLLLLLLLLLVVLLLSELLLLLLLEACSRSRLPKFREVGFESVSAV